MNTPIPRLINPPCTDTPVRVVSLFRRCVQLAIMAGMAMGTTSCASPLAQRAQRADGLLGFIFDYPGVDSVPVERRSSGAGEIVTAHAVAVGSNLRVSGLVRKLSLRTPQPGAHIDIVITDRKQRIVQRVATDYLPRDFPSRIRGNPGFSSYSVRFPFLPPTGSTVLVTFDDGPKSRDEFAHSF